ncbi:MAG TPA: cyclase family protein [Chloroflexota bacterium]|nr:cyclase family protein [Chloroflexota bacterium]
MAGTAAGLDGQANSSGYGALPVPRLDAALRSLIGAGRVFSLQQPLHPDMPQWAVQPAYSLQTVLTHDDSAAMMERPATGSFERIEHSGHSGTHIDALCHVGNWHDDQPYLHGDVPAREVYRPTGYSQLGAEHFPPILVRGVLLDVAASKGVDVLPDLYTITADDLRECEARQGVKVGPSAAVLLRTSFARYWHTDQARYMGRGAGAGAEAARFLAERGCVVTGADTANYEVLAFPALPAHVVLLYEHAGPFHSRIERATGAVC